MTKTARLIIGLAMAAALSAGSAVAGPGAPTTIYRNASSVRNQEPPDPCIAFHGRSHAHCVARLEARKRRHGRIDPYKN
jgi:hypothetical protein